MTKEKEIIEKYRKQLMEEKEEELTNNSDIIRNFIDLCKDKQINLTKDNFDYVPTIGVVATFPNLVYLLNNKIIIDKEELVEVDFLEKEFKSKPFLPGYYCSDKFMVMAHPYFRRGHYQDNSFSPMFIDIFCKYKKENNQKYIAIDFDRVRIDIDNSVYKEFDTWFGAKFKNKIEEIEDGIVKLKPPLGLEPFHVEFLFGNTYSLDIKWSSKNGIKVFQAEEFKELTSKIKKNGKEFYPVKYLHAEFSSKEGIFRHFDGAIHFYTEEEYFQRRDNDFNYNNKNNLHLKTLSQKLFKVNGQIETNDWVNLVSHYLTGNPLIIEYFEGKLPDRVIDIVDTITKDKNTTPLL